MRADRCKSLQRLACMAARWSDDHRAEFADADPDMGMIINRIADNWRPLFAIADVIGEIGPSASGRAANDLTPREANSHDTILLADIKAILDERAGTGGEWADRMFSEMFAEALAAIEGGRWVEYGKARKPITKNQLAQLLKKFKITPDSVRIEKKVAKGYYRHQFEGMWERYLAPQGGYETEQRNKPTAAGTSTPFPNGTEKADVTDENYEKPLWQSGCYGVRSQKGEKSPEGANGQGNGAKHPADDDQDKDGSLCDHCNLPGSDGDPLLEVAAGGPHAHLHRGCVNGWKGATKDLLANPDFSSTMNPEKRQ